MQKVRTTVYLEKDLVEAAKLVGLSRNMALTGLVESGLKKELGLTHKKAKQKKLKLGTYSLGEYKFRRADAYE